jgi:hypothetical protein
MNLCKLFLLSIVVTLCLSRSAFPQDDESAKKAIAQANEILNKERAKLDVNKEELNDLKVRLNEALERFHVAMLLGGKTAHLAEGKSPAIKVMDADGKELASIPLEKNPGRFVYSETTNTLYVVQSGKKGDDFISAVNLTMNQADKQIKIGWNIISNLVVSKSGNMLYVVHANESGDNYLNAVSLATHSVDKQIKVGAGAIVKLNFLNGGRRLFCFTGGKVANGIESIKTNNCKPPFEPSTSVIDTASNELITTYNWFDSFRASTQLESAKSKLSRQLFLEHFAANSKHNGGSLIINWDFDAHFGTNYLKKIIIYLEQYSTPIVSIDPGGRIVGWALSKDEKLFIMAIESDKKANGTLVVVDLENGKAVYQALNDAPRKLLRLGSSKELWLFCKGEMLSVSESGLAGERQISFNKVRKQNENSNKEVSELQDGSLGEAITLGDDHAAIMISNKHKVALIDLKNYQVDAIIPTMDMTKKTAMQVATVVGAALGAVVALAADSGGMYVPISMSHSYLIENNVLAARSDGLLLYTLDTYGDTVTVIDTQAAKIVKRISVSDHISKIEVSSDGKHLICTGTVSEQEAYTNYLNYSGPVTQQINLETYGLEK